MAQGEKKEYRITNSATVAAGAYWYPFSETGAPSDNDYVDFFPMRSLIFKNGAGEEAIVIRDPAPISSAKRDNVSTTKTLIISNEDNETFHNVAVLNNDGSGTVQIDEWDIRVTNY